ncbi:hypothetical protein B0H14DRAFT_3441782 [Mycena olivaceomarginata]|nr:hypothetical protein B0H14DRAFT_3441782 [Mycena olivaceomarginata]
MAAHIQRYFKYLVRPHPAAAAPRLGSVISDFDYVFTENDEVPLPAVHHLREALNAVPLEEPVPAEVFAPCDAPVIAGAVKLRLLELDLPLALWEGWDDIRKIYLRIIPLTLARKKRESERKISLRKRTAPVDMRFSRSRISVGADAKRLLAAQQVAQDPSLHSVQVH